MLTSEERSERAKKTWADRKAREASNPALQEAILKQPLMSNVPTTGEAPLTHDRFTGDPLPDVKELQAKMTKSFKENLERKWTIDVDADWEHLPMGDAQQAYATLKFEFEKAGKILNARSTAEQEGYTCFICKKRHSGRPGMTDLSYQDPETGLFPRIDLCGEHCVIRWQAFRVEERCKRFLREAHPEEA
jgi:hypothetical protein